MDLRLFIVCPRVFLHARTAVFVSLRHLRVCVCMRVFNCQSILFFFPALLFVSTTRSGNKRRRLTITMQI